VGVVQGAGPDCADSVQVVTSGAARQRASFWDERSALSSERCYCGIGLELEPAEEEER
jgi:hypothetical protein